MARLWDAIRESSARGGAVVRPGAAGMTIRVTVWNEYRQERSDRRVAAIYPDGIHAAIADGMRERDGSRSGPRRWTTRSRA